jgi:ribosomal protein S18 acetylase RimI-like enzyme
MDIFFKIGSLEDLPLLQEIGYETFNETFKHMNTPSNMNAYLEKAFNLEKLKQELINPNSTFYFMYSEGNLAGYLKVNIENAQTELAASNSLEIERIYLNKEYQGKGFGRILLNKGLEIAENMGKTFVWLGVWEKNTTAIAFYKKMGFTEIDTHVFYMGDEKQTDYIMRKTLGN